MKLSPELQKSVSGSLLRIGARSPYFATLAMHANYEETTELGTAATDGRTIFINKDFWNKQNTAQADGLLLHEVLHAALLHVPRCAGREREQWNIAADIVINGMVLREGWQLPEGGIIRSDLEHLSTEEIYDKLMKDAKKMKMPAGAGDLLGKLPKDADQSKSSGSDEGDKQPQKQTNGSNEDFWRATQEKAKLAHGHMPGSAPAGLKRELGQMDAGKLNWRSYLWRYLTHTPTDFTEFDRRYVGRGMYLDAIAGESVNVLVCVDTSGSIDQDILQLFVNELQGILRSYPQLRCELYYCDTQLNGPHALKPHSPIPTPVGGGGTSFHPFFEQVRSHPFTHNKTVAIYLTDGFADFPASPPKVPVLWVVTPGGLDLDKFPFGETVRLVSHA